MAMAASRSCNNELNQGCIDGTYKQVNMNRGGVIDPATEAARKDLSPTWHGMVEAQVKEMPDGIGPVRTPTTVSTPPQSACGC
jgi:hypothetical protein